jgi:23S rRNA pseudouridine2605 synthase
MREGKNREVKNVLGHLGLAVNRLIRVSFGPFQLGDLPAGAVEEVRTRHLREQLGARLVALAGVDFSRPIVEREEPAASRPAGARATPVRPEPKAGRRASVSKGVGSGSRADARVQNDKRSKRRSSDSERLGEPELARREKHRRRFRGKRG